jgi:hypothetical protein
VRVVDLKLGCVSTQILVSIALHASHHVHRARVPPCECVVRALTACAVGECRPAGPALDRARPPPPGGPPPGFARGEGDNDADGADVADVYAELDLLVNISALVEGGEDADAASTPAEPRGAWCPCLCPMPPPPLSRGLRYSTDRARYR